MAEGNLTAAGAALAAATSFTPQMSEEGRVKIRGLVDRHQGTVELLRGNLDAADRLFTQFEKAVTETNHAESARLEAIARYKRARVLMERIREWEPFLSIETLERPTFATAERADYLRRLTQRAPDVMEVQRWCEEAGRLIKLAWGRLRALDRGDRKWFPAIDISAAYLELLTRRTVQPALQRSGQPIPGQPPNSMGAIPRVLPGSDVQPQGRRLELEVLAVSYALQVEIEQPASTVRQPGVVVPHPDQALECREWEVEAPHAYKQSWREYERMYYRWRALKSDGNASSDSQGPRATRDAGYQEVARHYRCGASLLYAHGMASAAHALHRLALVCFADRADGLQERLEASAALPAEPAVRSQDIKSLMDRIAVEAIASVAGATPTHARDVFFTIPTKVICRLVGAHDMYCQIIKDGRQPGRITKIRQDGAYLLKLAKELALECMYWQRLNPDWQALAREARLASPDVDDRLPAVEAHAKAMHDWLQEFTTSPIAVAETETAASATLPNRRKSRRRRRHRPS